MVSTILLVAAFIMFVLAALPVATKFPVALVPAGLACWVLAQLIGTGLIN